MLVFELHLQNKLQEYSLCITCKGSFDGFQFLIKDLNSTKDSTFCKAVGIEFHIKVPKYFMEF